MWRRNAILILLFAWPAAVALAAEPLGMPTDLRRVPAPRDAALAAWLDLSTRVPAHQHQHAFYIWDNLGTRESAAAINFTVNAVLAQATTIVSGQKIDGPPVLLRYHLAELAPVQKDLDRLFAELQKLADFEPYFHQPVQEIKKRKVKKPVSKKVVQQIKVPLPQYGAGAYRIETREVEETTLIEVEETYGGRTEPALHAGGDGPLRLLSEQTGSLLPIVRADWFLATAWSSIAISGVQGRYYELAGIEKSRTARQSDFDLFLESVGADPALVAKLRSDQRSVQISGVTGKWRQIEYLHAAGVRPESGPSLVTITHDIKDDETNAKRHPLLNLLQFEDQAREVIAPKRNGLHLFLLTDGKGALQAEAPPDVAAWPASPHATKRLTAGISCLECHGGNRGYNPTENYVHQLIRRGFVPLADLTVDAKKDSLRLSADTLDLIKGKYDGDLNIALKEAGNAYARAVDRATAGVFGVRSVEGASAETVRLYSDYFARVTPRQLLRELGYDAEEEQAVAVLQRVVPAAAQEDPRIAAIRLGLPILRGDVQEIYFAAALRDVLRAPVPPIPVSTLGGKP